MFLQWLGGHRDAREHAADDLVRGDLVGQRFERKHDAVPDHVEGEVL